jgi:hypothetical protein
MASRLPIGHPGPGSTKDEKEKRFSFFVGIPFLLLLFAISFISTLMLKSK